MKIIYIYDALCGWCYGFSPVIQKAWEKFGKEMDFTVLSGGMMTDKRIGTIKDVAPYVKTAYRDVESRTGVKFGADFVKNFIEGDSILSSVEPAVAMCIFRELKPDQSIAFASALQKAINFHGQDPTREEMYKKLATDFGLDPNEFAFKMAEETYHQMAEEEFNLVASWGVTGFPTVVGEKDGEYYLISRGYADEERFLDALQQFKDFPGADGESGTQGAQQ